MDESRNNIHKVIGEIMVTKFNPENKEILTYRESLGPAMKITDQEDADQYFAALVTYTQKELDANQNERKGLVKKTTEEIVKENLVYFSGYYSDSCTERVRRLFYCSKTPFSIFTEGVKSK